MSADSNNPSLSHAAEKASIANSRTSIEMEPRIRHHIVGSSHEVTIPLRGYGSSLDHIWSTLAASRLCTDQILLQYLKQGTTTGDSVEHLPSDI